MGREKDRKLHRRRRRRVQMHKFKARLAKTKDQRERNYLIQKINKISIYPIMDVPKD